MARIVLIANGVRAVVHALEREREKLNISNAPSLIQDGEDSSSPSSASASASERASVVDEYRS